MKTTVRHSQFVDARQVPFTSSLVLSIVLHSVLVLWMIGGAWLLSRMQPYRLASHTVFLGGDSPFAIDQIPGEGGAGSGIKPESKEPGAALPSAQADARAEPAVEKFAPAVEKPVPPPPQPAVEKPIEALPPKPVIEKAVPPPPKPVVERPLPPTPAPKPVANKALPVPPKPPPEAMTLAHKETKPTTPAPPSSTATEVQQAVAKRRERQMQQEAKETKTATEVQQRVVQLRQRQAEQERVEQAAQQRVAGLRAEQAEQQAAQQRVAALRARTSSAGSAGGAADTGSGSGLPGGGRGTGTAGSGGVGTGGLSGIRLRGYQDLVQKKVYDAWSVPPQSKGLQAIVFLTIDRSGRIEQLRFVQRSGNVLFDESLQRAIKHAEPLPPLPADYAGPSLEAELRFRPLD